jgi:NAD-dependent SIR2 family protein deacetylase
MTILLVIGGGIYAFLNLPKLEDPLITIREAVVAAKYPGMPVKEVEAATQMSQECDCFIVVGSTLLVQPASYMPVYAKQQGSAFLAIINLSETPCDDMCDVLIRESAGETLSRLVELVKEKV